MPPGWVNASRPENINQIKHLDEFLQANFVLKQGLASGYESEVLAGFKRNDLLGISLIRPIVERSTAEIPGLDRVRSPTWTVDLAAPQAHGMSLPSNENRPRKAGGTVGQPRISKDRAWR